MKMNFKTIGLLSIAILLSMAACKKDDDTSTNPTTTEYLTAGNWKVTSMTIDPGVDFGGGVIITDFFAQFPACTKDDLIRFNTNGSITDDEGATKCDAGDPQTETTGSWSLSADNKMLTVSYPDEDPLVITITSINSTSMTGTYTMVEDFGDGDETYTITTGFVLQ